MSDEPGDGEWGDLGDEIQDRIDDAIEVEMEKCAAMTDHATRVRSLPDEFALDEIANKIWHEISVSNDSADLAISWDQTRVRAILKAAITAALARAAEGGVGWRR